MATRNKRVKEEADNLDNFLDKAENYDPLLLWGVLRSKILPHVPLWDVLVNKAVLGSERDAPAEKLRDILRELDQLLESVSVMLLDCCEPCVKGEEEEGEEEKVVLSEVQKHVLAHDNGWCKIKVKDFCDCPPQFAVYFFPQGDTTKKEIKEEEEEDDDFINNDDGSEDDVHEESTIIMQKEKHGNKKCVNRSFPKECPECRKPIYTYGTWRFHIKPGKCPGSPQPTRWTRVIKKMHYCTHPDCGMANGVVTPSSKKFTTREACWRHLVDEHTTEKDLVFPCSSCNERFPFQKMLDYHTKQKHVKQFICEYCGASFCVRAILKKHERIHKSEKPYSCELCPYKTHCTSMLYAHKKRKHEMYTGYSHVCDLCGKKFCRKYGLQEHLYTHSDIKRFSCEICGRQLKNDSCYRRHMVCVHGQKFTCEVCGKDFSSNVGVKYHKREAHGILY